MARRFFNRTGQRRPHFIKEWREYRGLKQPQLAERIGVTKATISRVENGETDYTQSLLEVLADALGCEPADLIVRNPMDPDAPWSIWETLKPSERRQAIEVIKAIKRSRDEEAA
jgi:transcriptional regulator with XRE-family HTH domain